MVPGWPHISILLLLVLWVVHMLTAAACRFQGEQNGGNPGNYLNKSGYACLLPALDNAWRTAFREGSSTNPEFPIGVVSLHGWCGEEEAECTIDPAARTDWTAKIRWAQTADWGMLPNPRLPHTFIAMAYDQPDPRNGKWKSMAD